MKKIISYILSLSLLFCAGGGVAQPVYAGNKKPSFPYGDSLKGILPSDPLTAKLFQVRMKEQLDILASIGSHYHNMVSQKGGHYEAYLAVLSQEDVPEAQLLASTVQGLIKKESNRLVEQLEDNAWSVGGEKFNEVADFGIRILTTVFFMKAAGKASHKVSGRVTNRNVLKNYGRLGGLSALSTKGGHWLSRFLLGGPWKGYGRVWLQSFILDLTVFTVVMEPLVKLYDRLMPRLANMRYLSDMKLAFHQSEAMLIAWQQLNAPLEEQAILLDYDGKTISNQEPDYLGWYNQSAKHNHLVLLYALRYLNHYAAHSEDEWRDQLVLLELLHLALPYGEQYKAMKDINIVGNPGRLFFPQERRAVVSVLNDMKSVEDYLTLHIRDCNDYKSSEALFNLCMRSLYDLWAAENNRSLLVS